MWIHQLLLADILRFTISVLEKNLRNRVRVLVYDFNHKFYNTFCKEQSH